MKNVPVELADVFKALGDPTRLKLVKLLVCNPERSLCVGALAHRLGVTQPAVSQHLRVLKNVGVVEPNRDGFRVHYTINKSTLMAFREDVDALCQLAFEDTPCPKECQESGQ